MSLTSLTRLEKDRLGDLLTNLNEAMQMSKTSFFVTEVSFLWKQNIFKNVKKRCVER